MTQPCYRIRNWDALFETSESRKRVTALPWVAIPTKHDGKGYRRLMRDVGPAGYGAWVLIVAVAAKCEPRGTLIDDGKPLTAEDIADKTDCPIEVISKTLQAVCDQRIAWMESVDLLATQQTPAGASPTGHDITGPDMTEHLPVRPESRPSEKDDLPDWPELEPFRQKKVHPVVVSELPEGIRGKLTGGKAFDCIEEAWLRSGEHLLGWHRWQLTLHRPVMGESVAHLLLTLCAAEEAIGMPQQSVRKNRVAVFVNAIKRRDWDSLRDRFPRALKRLEAMP